MPLFSGTKNLLNKARNSFSSDFEISESENLHTELVKTVMQLKATQNVISNNSNVINKLSKNNSELFESLKILNSLDTQDIEEKVLNREAISKEEADMLLQSLHSITDAVSKIGVDLDVNLGELISDLKPLLQDSRIDVVDRRKILEDIRDFATEQDISSSILEDLKNINTKQLTFTEQESNRLQSLLSSLSLESEKVTAKSTLVNLNKSLDSAVITKEELIDVLDQKTESGETFLEKFKKIPELFSQGSSSTLKTAGLSSGIDMLLPGLGSLLESTGLSSKLSGVLSLAGAKSALGGTAGLVSKLFSKSLPTPELEQDTRLQDTVKETAKENTILLEDNIDSMKEIKKSIGSLADSQSVSETLQEQQIETMERGFDDLENAEKKSRRFGLGIGRSPTKGLGFAGGLGIATLLKSGPKGIGTLLKSAVSLAVAHPAILGLLAAAGVTIATVKASKKNAEPVDLGGKSVSDKQIKLDQKAEIAQKFKNSESDIEIFGQDIGTSLQHQKSVGLKTVTKGAIEISPESDIKDISEFEFNKNANSTPNFKRNMSDFYTSQQPSFPGVGTIRSTDRKLSIEDPYIAIVNSTLFD